MAQHEHLPVRSRPAPVSLPQGWEKDITHRFRQRLSTKRMNELSRRSASPAPSSTSHRPSPLPRATSLRRQALPARHGTGAHHTESPAAQDTFDLGLSSPSHNSLHNIPLIPTAPTDAPSQQFRNHLHMLSEMPCKWENPGLLDEAMREIPLDRIYSDATDEHAVLQATAESIGKKPAWAWQDCVIRALLKWFKSSFFTWISNPPCSRCGSPTVARGMVAPTADEKALGGNRVELYQCSYQDCRADERFPRYSDAFVLMRTRRGRLGEWASCFSMLCRAMGSRVRWVWNSEDHVWTEVYSDYRKRWVHVDACEGVFDKPLLYNEGWHKKIAYCIAFSSDGAMDVTRRYCRNPSEYGLERTRCTEASLLWILDEIRNMRRRSMPKDDKFRLEGEDMREFRELRHYYVSCITAELAKIKPRDLAGGHDTRSAQELADAQKARERAEERERLVARSKGNGGADKTSQPRDGGPR